MGMFRRIANLLSSKKVAGEIETELSAHLEMRIADSIAAGMSAEEARRDALLRFGNLSVTRERVAAADAALGIHTLWADVRFGLRQLRRSPAFTFTVILTLALGIGPNTAVFSVMNSVLLRPLAYPHSEQIFQLEKGTPSDSTYSASTPLYLEWRRENTVFSDVAAYSVLPQGFNLAEKNRPERVPGLRVSAEFFRVLGVAPQIGRGFAVGEDAPGARPVAILSHGLWRRRFASDPDILGQSIVMDGRSYTVIGVLPEAFRFLAILPAAKAIEVWTPLELPAASHDPAGILECIGRLRAGVNPQQAAAQLAALGRRAAIDVPPAFPSDGIVTLTPLQQRIVGDARPTILLFFAAVSIVLLIACANVANLLLARMAGRTREIGVRTALGASWTRILRQILTESMVLACLGGTLGMAIAFACVRALAVLAPPSIADAGQIHLDWRVPLFALSVSGLAGLAAGLLPALRMLRVPASEAMRDAASRGSTPGRSNRSLSSTLVIAEMALSLLLLVAAGLLIESFIRLERVNPGFDFAQVTTFETTLPVERYGSPAALDRFIRDARSRISALPGVESVAAQSSLPTQPTLSFPFTLDAGPQPKAGDGTGDSDYLIVSGGFFQALRIPVLQGRALLETDNAQSPAVVVINQAMARKYFPGQDPVGKRITIAKPMGPDWADPPRVIVGVCGDVRNDSIEQVAEPTMYTPLAQASQHMITVLLGTVPLHWTVRAAGTSAPSESQLQTAITTVDSEEPVAEVRGLADLLADSLVRWRFNMLLVAAFAAIALALAAVGIYGMISYAVAQRTQEIAVRIALGARRSAVLWMIIRQAALLLCAGCVLGLAGLAATGKMLEGFIYGIGWADARILTAVTALLFLVGLVAAWRPARRAAGVHPMQALRGE